MSELTPIRAAAVATPGTLHRLIARLDEPCPAALARKEAAAKLREESCPSRLLVEIGHPAPAVHEMPDSPSTRPRQRPPGRARRGDVDEHLFAPRGGARAGKVVDAPAALPLHPGRRDGHAWHYSQSAPVVVNATYGYAEPSPDVVALRDFVEATPRRCASSPSAPSCRTDNLPDMPLGAWFRAAH